MRKRMLLPVGSALVVLVAGYLMPRTEDSDSLGDFREWEPTPGTIARAVSRESPGAYGDARHQTFARMFQQRFRNHQFAVGFKFLGENRAKLMCAATINRWDMARLGVQAYHEVRDVFGKAYQVDIYETYISMPQRKLAEVRPRAGTDRLAVTFSPRFEQERELPPTRQHTADSVVDAWEWTPAHLSTRMSKQLAMQPPGVVVPIAQSQP